MKRTILLIMGLTLISLSFSMRPIQQDDYPILPVSIEKAVGEAVWYYTWPHGLVPMELDGYTLVSGPFEYTKPTHGKTAENWGMKTVYASKKEGIHFSVWVLADKSKVDRTMFAIGPISPAKDTATFTPWEFHMLKAGIAILEHKTIPGQSFDRQGKAQGDKSVILAFRMEDKLFLICSRAAKPVDVIEQTLIPFAEQVYQLNSRIYNNPTTPPNRP